MHFTELIMLTLEDARLQLTGKIYRSPVKQASSKISTYHRFEPSAIMSQH